MRTYKFNCKTVFERHDESQSDNVLIEVQAENAEAAEKLAIEQYKKQTDENEIGKEIQKNIEAKHLDVYVEANLVK